MNCLLFLPPGEGTEKHEQAKNKHQAPGIKVDVVAKCFPVHVHVSPGGEAVNKEEQAKQGEHKADRDADIDHGRVLLPENNT